MEREYPCAMCGETVLLDLKWWQVIQAAILCERCSKILQPKESGCPTST